MATRLATQRNFVTITPTSTSKERKPNNNSSGVISITPSESGDQRNSNQGREIDIDQVISQKKLLLQTNDSGVTVVDVVPVDSSDSSNESPITVPEVAAIESDLSPCESSSSIPQQVGAQVTVVHSQSPDEGNSPRFITVTVSTQDNVTAGGPYQVQYVDPELYHNSSQNQSQMTYPFCAVGDYQSNSQSYYSSTANYTNSSSTSSSHSSGLPYIVPVDESLLCSSQNRESPQSLTTVSTEQEVTYIPENHPNAQQTPSSTTAGVNDTENAPNITHATRISPATVSWLMENYETAEGVSLPRSTLYNHYMQHCNENKLEAVNAASFGKLIRSVFTGLRTRRLGTRGNSKYHYYGIRVKPGSALIQALEEKSGSYPGSSGNSNMNKGIKKLGAKPETYEACSQYLGDGTGAIPIFPSIEIDCAIPGEITIEDFEIFRSMYREHCELFLDAVLNLEFSTIESLWRDFWRSSDNNNIDECEEEKYLSKSKLYLLCQCKSVQNFIKQVDYLFYQNMVEVLIPDVLRSIPNSLTQAIRNFAKNLEIWLSESMNGCPEKIIKIKSSAVSAFCQTLRRYTSLNHLAQAARAVLQNSSQIAQMLNDLNRVDFHNVQEQAAWVCQCDTATVQRLENDFKAALQQQNSLEQWAAWLRLVVDTALEDYRGKPNYAKAARQFLLKWSFYSSMVIRDLTLRSASSFGSFHLIRLLYDEYMFFLIEHKVAEAQRTTAIAVMSNKLQEDSEFDFVYPTEFDIKLEPQTKRIKH